MTTAAKNYLWGACIGAVPVDEDNPIARVHFPKDASDFFAQDFL